jgi:hypothetical protein
MKRLLFPLLAIALVPQLPAGAQPPREYDVPRLAAAIADGNPFVVQLNPGESYGTLIGGERYFGRYNPDNDTFTVNGPNLQTDGAVVLHRATYRGADPMQQELSLWGAVYNFDARGNLYLGNRLAGKVWLRK